MAARRESASTQLGNCDELLAQVERWRALLTRRQSAPRPEDSAGLLEELQQSERQLGESLSLCESLLRALQSEREAAAEKGITSLLIKQGGKVKNWKMRTFVLRPKEARVDYYEPQTSAGASMEMRGSIAIASIVSVRPSEVGPSRQDVEREVKQIRGDYRTILQVGLFSEESWTYQFEIETPDRVYHVCAETHQERERWLRALTALSRRRQQMSASLGAIPLGKSQA
eukprot:TRINITY_DN22685_c1_g1_i1.p1 TRINITY_DN22685_c1_g1~~TRINITY_DN22685_c1_g1_i1.p1  ORF type:complete len:256 (+),score=74.84 TRINITY_DN22685_c1_g1_i1:85-768(+)